MFDCSRDAEFWIRHALECVPAKVWETFDEDLAFVCMDSSDGKRLTREFRENHEIILLSERIVPAGYRAEDDPKVRYFWFAVLHEVAHAYCDHASPKAISVEENVAQELDADKLAFTWFNDYLKSKKQPEFTDAELKKAKAASLADWEKVFGKH